MSHNNSSAGRLKGWLQRPRFWFAVALVVRLLYLLEQGGTSPLFYQPLLDEKEALDSATAILKGQVEAEPYFKAPGYAWLMALVLGISGEAWPWTLRALQHLAGAGLVYMGAWLAGRLTPAATGRPLAVGIAGFLGALYAPLIRLESNISLDFWVVFFQSAMLCRLVAAVVEAKVSWRRVLIAGLFAACAWVTRPTLTVALPFVALWVGAFAGARAGALSLRIRRGIMMAAVFLLPVIITAGGLLVRNLVVSGDAMVLPWQGGYSLYYANRTGASGRYFVQDRVVDSEYANPTRALAIGAYLGQLPPGQQEDFASDPDYGAVNSFWFDRTLEDIEQDPTRWLLLMFRKCVYLFSDKEIYNYEDYDLQRSLSTLLIWMPGRFGVIFPLAMATLAVWPKLLPRRRAIHGLLWLYVVMLGAAIAAYYVSGRMRMPLAFPLIPLAGCGAAGMLRGNIKRNSFAAGLVATGLILSWGDWWGVRSESMAHVDLARMSNAAWHRGKYEQALDLVLKAEALAPDYPTLPSLKGQALYGLGQKDAARREFERSVKVLGDTTSRRNIQIIDEETGQQPEPPQ